jgi:uncharacterized protein
LSFGVEMPLNPSRHIEVKWTAKKGRGVFARERIEKGTIIEKVPIVAIPLQEVFGAARTAKLSQYVFNLDSDSVAIALGYGSLYNHSYEPNADYFFPGRFVQVFRALRTIAPGEEITINYNGKFRDRSPLWFKVT